MRVCTRILCTCACTHTRGRGGDDDDDNLSAAFHIIFIPIRARRRGSVHNILYSVSRAPCSACVYMRAVYVKCK